MRCWFQRSGGGQYLINLPPKKRERESAISKKTGKRNISIITSSIIKCKMALYKEIIRQIWNVVHMKDNYHGLFKKSMPCLSFVNDILRTSVDCLSSKQEPVTFRKNKIYVFGYALRTYSKWRNTIQQNLLHLSMNNKNLWHFSHDPPPSSLPSLFSLTKAPHKVEADMNLELLLPPALSWALQCLTGTGH